MLPFLFSPFKGGIEKWLNQHSYVGDINKYVQDMVTQSLAHSTENNHITEAMGIFNQGEKKQEPVNSSPHVSAFETHDHVYVRVLIKDESHLATLKVFHTSNQLIIEGLPTLDDKHVVTLPSIVKMRGAVSEYREGFLQIRLVKRTDLQFTEIDVQS
jgi:HSP20 family molecular chaperone IbpA